MKPFLRWAGSKRQSIDRLIKYWSPNFNRYIEPFAGSACLFFAIQPKKSIISDINYELINTYRMVQLQPSLVIESLCRMPVDKKSYYMIRRMNPIKLAETERAARLIYLNQYCFNGLFRTNKNGEFNVPYGNRKGRIFKDFDLILEASRALRFCKITHTDFENALSECRSGDFIYLDPPYFATERRIFNEYNGNLFVSSDLKRLKNALHKIDSRGISFIMSYARTVEAEDLFRAWHMSYITVKRNISGFEGARRFEQEILITNIEGKNDEQN
jgi:DNA adenine methylase